MKLLVIIFIIKLVARNIFNVIRWKYGHETLRNSRKLEKLCLRLEKINCDLKFLLQCKRNNVIPRFAKPKLSIYASYKIKQKIARTIIETEITNKHQQKKKLKRELKELSSKLRGKLRFVSFQSLKYRIREVVSQKKTCWLERQKTKMDNLKARLRDMNNLASKDFVRKVVHNFSSLPLTEDEVEALSYGIDHLFH